MKKILIVTDEVWNDRIFGNGVLTNWFTGFHAEFAHIYCSPGLPYNDICKKYFRITDGEMVKSLISSKKAGCEVELDVKTVQDGMMPMHQGIYRILKNISLILHEPMMMLRDFIWCFGRYDRDKMYKFVKEFNPDVVFCPRMATPKMLRLEKYLKSIIDVPFIAFTGDNELYKGINSWNLFSKIRKCYINKIFSGNKGIYTQYLMHSKRQADEYAHDYGVKTDMIYKCSDIDGLLTKEKVNTPIVLVYAGRLYCNRWKILAKVGEALTKININGVKMVLNIYTQDKLNKKQSNVLNENNYIYYRGCVTPDELKSVYGNSDIALHVESFDEKYRLSTQYSFSTKIIDLLSSSCAVMAIGWNKQCGCEYLQDNDAAICINDLEHIEQTLRGIIENPNMILEYSKKAQLCVINKHNRKFVHEFLKNIFSEE